MVICSSSRCFFNPCLDLAKGLCWAETRGRRWRSTASGIGGLVHVQDSEHCSLNNPEPSGEGEGVALKFKSIHSVYANFQLSSFSVTL